MKVLTIREPWASLIVNGYKKYEFRSWKTKYRGKLLIHAGSKLEKDMVSRFSLYNLDYKMGYIVGEANLVDCILVDEDFNNRLLKENNIVYGKSNHVEKYAWKLEDIVMYKEPIYVKGKLGLWDYNDDINKSYSKIKN
ncbi:MAG: ASCH domain-containing protein [Bacilli bacterium]|nr:ASCH domain-containing protein [Bacilli bacterium]